MLSTLFRLGEVAALGRRTGTWVAARLGIKSERGATAVEYGLMVALIAAVIIAAVTLIGNASNDKFCEVGDAIDAAGGGADAADCAAG